jgi:hypothetical protein
MEKEFVPYEQALDLKELGFDEPCLLRIQYSSGYDVFTGRKFQNSIWLGNGYEADIDDKKIKYKFPYHSEQKYGNLKIPLYQQAFRWFREKYGLFHSITEYNKDGSLIIEISKDRVEIFRKMTNFDFTEYRESELECLKELIEIVKRK